MKRLKGSLALFLVLLALGFLLPASQVLAADRAQAKAGIGIVDIDFEPDEITLSVGQSQQTNVVITPRNASNQQLRYTSNNPSVVSVSNTGVVTALKTGTAIITATAQDGSYENDDLRVYVRNSSQTTPNIPVDDIEFNPDEYRLTIGQVVTPYVEIEPYNATNKALTYSSSNPQVATVDAQGNITAVSSGFAVIYAVAQDGSYERGDCEVWVVGQSTPPSTIFVDDVEFKPDEVYLTVGQTSKLYVQVDPVNATNKTLSFSSNNPAVATVDANGNATAVSPGVAIIFARATDGSGEGDSCTLVVRDSSTTPSILIDDIDVEPDYISLAPGQTRTLNITIEPYNATNKTLNYYSSNNAVATVQNGVVTAVSPGIAFLTISSTDGSNESDTCSVVVTGTSSDTNVPVTDIDFVEDEIYMQVGETCTVSVQIQPPNATNQNYSLENFSGDIISVGENNTVTALKPGTGILVVRALDGSNKADTCEIRVVGNPSVNPGVVPVEDVDFNPDRVTVAAGSTLPLTVTVEPSYATNKTLSFKSNDPMIATVDQNGVVTGVAAGTTVVTATATDGSNEADACVVTVTGTQSPTPSPETPTPSITVSYETHVQNIGWQSPVQNGAISGTSGQALQLEGIKINVAGDSNLGIEYRTHVENIGWQAPVTNGGLAGTTGQALQLEAIQINLTGSDAGLYNVYYRVHAQDVGWMNWAQNGESAGTAGFARQLEAIQIQVLPKTSPAPTTNPPNNSNLAFIQG